ncbi:MAG TPA: protein-methionine-sulfoxide reductase catalytic subunit MsrP [Burkholderiaceae bacterium]|nr:protein-methionine-sulfoxide reductase catalytic subunit MsrP [Burkholderiaceae bacterium]
MTIITPEPVWKARRDWIKRMGASAALTGGVAAIPGLALAARQNSESPASLPATPHPDYQIDARLTAESDVTQYNNFYEFGTGKSDPYRHAHRMDTEPWTVRVEGEVHRPATWSIDDLIKLAPQEERIYRLRCVEGWSMVIPWIGYSLSVLLKQADPTGNAKFVEFVSAKQEDNMPGLAAGILDWPYTEGLRMDEAMHPLAMLVFGVYGNVLPNQNGAPLRLAAPWKYGFKSAKSIVTIRLRADAPDTSWNLAAPHEYGFYANVNPDVPHPRWSQSTERRIGDGRFAPRVPTLPFNGYAQEVAHLYQGMDLAKDY